MLELGIIWRSRVRRLRILLKATYYRFIWAVGIGCHDPMRAKRAHQSDGSVTLLTQYYDTGDTERDAEIQLAFRKNTALRGVDRIVYFSQTDNFKPSEARATVIPIMYRLTFRDVFDHIRRLPTFRRQDIFILCNSDIEITRSVVELARMIRDTDFIALSRRDVDGSLYKSHYLPEISQDVWIFKGCFAMEVSLDRVDFELGKPGCDAALARSAYDLGYALWNPCLDVVAIHHHKNPQRNYTEGDRIISGYACPIECGVHQFYLNRRASLILSDSTSDAPN